MALLRDQVSTSPAGNWPGFRWFNLSGTLLLACLGVFSLIQLQKDAKAEHAVRSGWIDLDEIKMDYLEVSQRADELQAELESNPSPELYDLLARYRFQQGRLAEVRSLRPQTDEQAIAYYQSTSRTNRHLSWRVSEPTAGTAETRELEGFAPLPFQEKTGVAGYRDSLELSRQLLAVRPLSLPARMNHVYLEFVHQDPEKTILLLEQSQLLYRNDPELLLQLAKLCADINQIEMATQLWNRVLLLRREWFGRVLNTSLGYDNVNIEALIPNSVEHNQLAREYFESHSLPAGRKVYSRRFMP